MLKITLSDGRILQGYMNPSTLDSKFTIVWANNTINELPGSLDTRYITFGTDVIAVINTDHIISIEPITD